MAAASTPPSATGTSCGPSRPHDSVASPSRRGSTSASDSAATGPSASPRSCHRRPSTASVPSTSSRPPPSGSASSSNDCKPRSAPASASVAARVDAPAPPTPPTTLTRQASPRPSSAIVNASRARVSSSPVTTSTAPSAIAIGKVASSRDRASSSTWSRRGSCARASSGARSSPTTTTGAARHDRRTAVTPCATSGVHPTAAHQRRASSSMRSSEVAMSGRWRSIEPASPRRRRSATTAPLPVDRRHTIGWCAHRLDRAPRVARATQAT
jgi:hypothetical protein